MKIPTIFKHLQVSCWVLAAFVLPEIAKAACATTGDPGILVSVEQPNFGCYINQFLLDIIPHVLTIAMIMIVFSGVQYMASGVTADGQKAAKQRIVGIVVGIMFFFAIRFILNQLSENIHI